MRCALAGQIVALGARWTGNNRLHMRGAVTVRRTKCLGSLLTPMGLETTRLCTAHHQRLTASRTSICAGGIIQRGYRRDVCRGAGEAPGARRGREYRHRCVAGTANMYCSPKPARRRRNQDGRPISSSPQYIDAAARHRFSQHLQGQLVTRDRRGTFWARPLCAGAPYPWYILLADTAGCDEGVPLAGDIAQVDGYLAVIDLAEMAHH